MKNTLRQGFAKKAILFAFLIGAVMPSALAYVDGGYPLGTAPADQVAAVSPSVQNLNVTTATGSATVSFSLNTNATTTVWIKDSADTIVRTLAFDNNLSGSTPYTYSWNGADNSGSPVASGNYKAQVVAYNSVSSDIESFSFVFTANGGSGITAPAVSLSVYPVSFDPTQGQSTTVSYTLNTQASLSVLVKLNGSVIRTLRAQSLQNSGSYTLVWDGKSDASTVMAPNTFVVEAYANNTAGTDTKSATVSIVKNDGGITAPQLSAVSASPTPFDPNSQNTNVYFTLDKAATVSVNVQNGSTIVKNLVNGASLSAGSYFYQWNGRDTNGNLVNDGTYTATISASNSAGSDSATTNVQVDTNGSGGNSCNIVSSSYVNPSSFNPNNQSAVVYYNLSRSAAVSVRIKTGANTTVKTLLSSSNQGSGSQSLAWNGRDNSGNTVAQGSYTYEITATASGCNSETTGETVTVINSGGGYQDDWASTNEDLIKNLYVQHEVFNPNHGEKSTVVFDLTHSARLIVQVLDGRTIVRTLRDVGNQSSGTYSYSWDGRDTFGNTMRDAVYTYRVMADDGNDTDTDRALTEVDTDGIIIGFPTANRCAGFVDVSVNSPFCKAIQLMSTKRIFEGYPDGTFRPYEPINRAETAKVVVLALGYDVTTGGYFGKQYSDTVAGAWYAPYLDVARKYNIATGYPDGSFRPASTINRVELLRVFLEANHLSLSSCSPQPFDDTPINQDTNWYMKYACYAKHNALMSSQNSNNLFPAQAMNRGDVANLFYDFEQKGLYSNYDGNGSAACVATDTYGNCVQYANNAYNNYNNQTCQYYDSRGICTQYSSSTSGDRYCESRNSSGNCIRWSNDNTGYSNSSNGYYTYQNGQYIWVAY